MRTRHAPRGLSVHVPLSIPSVRRPRPAGSVLVVLALLLTVLGTGIGTADRAYASTVSFEVPFRCGEVWYGGTRAGTHGNAIDFNQGWPDSIDETGVPVLASAAGTVTVAHRADSWGGGYGYWVEIDHGGGWKTRYAHLYAPPRVNVGQWVPAGEHIGGVGNTGNSFGAHMHYEQLFGGQKQPPTFRGVAFDLWYQSGAYQGERIVSQNSCGPVRVPNPCGTFWDTPTGGFCDQILWAVDTGITSGYTDGTFLPGSAVSRQAMAAFLYRFTGTSSAIAPSYRDVTVPHPFENEIGWLQSTGLTQGYGDGTFRPTAPITRQALAAFLWRLAGAPTVAGVSTFPDVPVDDPFHDAITWMASSGVTMGYPDGTFRPVGVLSRQEMVAFLHRMSQVATARSADVPVVEATSIDVPSIDVPETDPDPAAAGLPEGVEVVVGAGDGGQEAAGPGEAASP